MKPTDVKSNSHTEYIEESNEKDPKFKVGIHVRIPKCKKKILKDIPQTGLKRYLLLKKLKIQFRG